MITLHHNLDIIISIMNTNSTTPNAQQPRGISNTIMASVLLRDAIISLKSSISNCKMFVNDIIGMPRGSKTTIQLNQLSTQLDYIQTIRSVIEKEISPFVRIHGGTSYLHKRLKATNDGRIPTLMKANLLPPPPPPLCSSTSLSKLQLSSFTSTPSSSSNKKSINKRQPIPNENRTKRDSDTMEWQTGN